MEKIYASIDMGGTKIAGALATAEGQVITQKTIATQSQEGPAVVLDRLVNLINELAAAEDCRPVALGMGVPGLADIASGTVRFLPNLPTQWVDVPVAAYVARQASDDDE